MGFGRACAPVCCAHPSFGLIAVPKGRCAPPRPSQLRCFLFDPKNKWTLYENYVPVRPYTLTFFLLFLFLYSFFDLFFLLTSSYSLLFYFLLIHLFLFFSSGIFLFFLYLSSSSYSSMLNSFNNVNAY